MADEPSLPDFDEIERALLGSRRAFTRKQVADKAGVPLDVAEELYDELAHANRDHLPERLTR